MKFNLKYLLPFLATAILIACGKDEPETPEPDPTPDPITNLDFTITTNEENPLQVAVTPTATGAESFKIYFDSVGSPTAFVSSDGALVTHTYPEQEETTTFTIKVVASNSNGTPDVELTKSHTITVTPDTVLIDFESMDPPYFKDDGKVTVEVVAGGIGDNSTAVGKITNIGDAYEASIILNESYIDMTGADKVIRMRFYQATAATPKLALKLEGNITDGGFDIEKAVDASAVEGWQTVEFDMSTAGNSYPNHENTNVTHSQYAKLILFIGFGQTDHAGEFYIDDITTAAPFGDAIPDGDGDGIMDTIDECPDEAGTAESNGCPAGPTTSATAPTAAADDILSIYSDAYTSQTIAELQTSWSANAGVARQTISASDEALALSFSAVNGYAGTLLAAQSDVTQYGYVHFDVYATSIQSFKIKFEGPGDGGPNAAETTVSVESTGEWVGVDVPLSEFTTVAGTGMPSTMNLLVWVGTEAGRIFVDNIYFHGDAPQGQGGGDGGNGDGGSSSVVFTVEVPSSATAVTFQSNLYGWDPNVPATDNGDGTWSYTISPAPSAALEYVWWVDGVSESADLIAAAAGGQCTALIEGSNFNTDYSQYANRKWNPGGDNQSGVYGSCSAPSGGSDSSASVVFTVAVPSSATAVTFQSNLYGWDPNVPATDNGDGTWSYTISPAPTAALEYVWWVDGVSESADLIAAAAGGQCTALIEGGNFNTDYANYANRKWSPGGANQSGTYRSCSN